MTYPTGAPSVQECLASVIVKEKPLRTTVPPTFIPIPPCRSWDSGRPVAFRSPISSKTPITRAPVWRASAAGAGAGALDPPGARCAKGSSFPTILYRGPRRPVKGKMTPFSSPPPVLEKIINVTSQREGGDGGTETPGGGAAGTGGGG